MPAIDFLQFGASQIRHQIREIITSYSHSWDILAETVQNAVDAVKKEDPIKGHLHIRLDRSSRIFEVEDNGCGIDASLLPQLMAPFASSKIDEASSVGEKGVGITFVLFSSESFEICTICDGVKAGYSLEGASGWLASNSSELPKLNQLDPDDIEVVSGTKISVRLPQGHPIFSFSFEELDFILRTRTAVGDTAHVFGLPPFNCDYTLTVVDEIGVEQSKEGECLYLKPTELLSDGNFADIDKYREWRSESDRSDAQKRNYWRHKAVTGQGSVTRDSRQIRYWFFYVPRRTWWSDLNKVASLVDQEDSVAEQQDEDANEDRQIGFSAGMHISTKFTPSGISTELKPRGSAGYVPNFFILIEDPRVKLDIGRKSIASPPVYILTAVAYDNFRKIINDVQKYTSGAPEFQSEFDRDEAFGEIEGLPNLNCEYSSFVKRPNNQEATVAAMFFEAIGSKRISDYSLLASGYKGKYDLFARKGHSKYVIEFKFDLKGLLKDFRDETKLFAEVDVVVLWEVTEADRSEAARRGLDLVENTTPFGSTNKFPEAKHKLLFAVGIVQEIWIIEMKAVLGIN